MLKDDIPKRIKRQWGVTLFKGQQRGAAEEEETGKDRRQSGGSTYPRQRGSSTGNGEKRWLDHEDG